MGIKAGSGRGSSDVGGSKQQVPGGVGSSRKRNRRNQMPPPPPKKPLRPTENPFPQKPDFRLGQYRVVEEKDDYLICTGYDPNAKDPFAEVTPSAFRSGALMKVAKPPALQRTMWEATTVTIDGVDYTYDYDDAEFGVRTVTGDDGSEEEQRIDPPYVLPSGIGDIIVAVQIRKNAAVDGMEVTDEEGTRLRWIDLNVSGRHWKGPGGESECRTVHEIRIEGAVTAGTFTLEVTVVDSDDTAHSDTLTFNWNDDSVDVQTEYESHPNIAPGDIRVIGGPFPNVSMYIVFTKAGTLNREQPLPVPDGSGLTGANARVKVGYMTNVNWDAV